MAAQIESANTEKNPSRWQRLLAWLAAFEQAMDYDPQEYTDASIRHLRAEVERLNVRLDAAEGRHVE